MKLNTLLNFQNINDHVAHFCCTTQYFRMARNYHEPKFSWNSHDEFAKHFLCFHDRQATPTPVYMPST